MDKSPINDARVTNEGSLPDGQAPPFDMFLAHWTARRIVLATLVVVGVGLAFLLLYRFYMVVFIFFVAVALQIALQPASAWLRQRGVPRGWDVGILYTLLLVLVGAVVWFVTPLLVEQIQMVGSAIPDYYQGLRTYLADSSSWLLRMVATNLPDQLASRATSPPDAADSLETVAPAWPIVASMVRVLFVLIATFVLAFYWSVEGELILRQLFLRVPLERRDAGRALFAEMESKIGGYLRGQFILCVIIGVLSTLAFLVLRIPNALVLGLFMGIFEAIPVIGPTLGAVPAVLMTLATAPEKTLWVIGALVTIQVLENHLLVPRVMSESVGVNAIVSILAIAAFGLLFGIGGAILAIPLAAILQILLDRLLFKIPIPAETTAGATASNGARTRISVLHLQTQELAQDLRQHGRAQTETSPAKAAGAAEAAEEAEDMLEAIAAELSSLLARMERPA